MDREAEIREILGRPYHRILVPDEETGVFSASIQEFEGCLAEGETAAEAYDSLERAARAWLEGVLQQGLSVPEPAVEVEYSGRIALRVPRSLHRRAVERAEDEGVSLNTYLVMAISESYGRSSGHPTSPAVKPAAGTRERTSALRPRVATHAKPTPELRRRISSPARSRG